MEAINNSSSQKNSIDHTAAKNATMILRAVNHKLRQQILKLLEDSGRMNVTDIYVKLRLEQSVASQHLAILRNASVVNAERDGKQIYYALNIRRVSQVANIMHKFVTE